MTDPPGKIRQADIQLGVFTPEKPRIYLLGGFQITWGSKEIRVEQIRLRRARDLLKLLALAPDHRLHRDQALEALWPEQDPQKSSRSLYQILYLLRPILASLDPTFTISLEDEYLALTAQTGLWTDIEAFEQAARNAHLRPDPAECQAALMLYRGDLLQDDLYSDLFARRREELRELRLSLLRQLAAYHTSQAEYPQAIELLEQLVGADPADEEAQGMLIRAYALSSQRPLALKQYQKLAEILQREFGTEPSEASQRLHAQLVASNASIELWTDESHPIQENNLPVVLSSFIGREGEILQVGHLIRARRLVTLTGAGGVGKTRLALKVAETVQEAFPGGVCWVELAPLENGSLLFPALMGALGVRVSSSEDPIEQLKGRLGGQDFLLILDNAEHILPACAPLVEQLLKGCPRLHVLVTSRAPLALQGETAFRVPSLRLPKADQAVDAQTASSFEALRLFGERACQKNASFRITPQNVAAVAGVCQRLDGIPLALELAAARLRMLTVQELERRLDDVFRLLTSGERGAPARQVTLKATIEWSCRLLTEKERQLLGRLSVFSGCWSLEAAEEVCQGEGLEPGEILNLLGGLVNQSLVELDFELHGVGYYRMLETVRQYAREQLLPVGAEAALRDRHLAYFTRLAERGDTLAMTMKEIELAEHFDASLGNLRMALDWSLRCAVVQGLRLSTSLYMFWLTRGLGLEAIGWWLRLLEVEEATRGPLPLKAERLLQRARTLRCTIGATVYYNSELSELKRLKMSAECLRLLDEVSDAQGQHERALALVFNVVPENMTWVDSQKMALETFLVQNDDTNARSALENLGIALAYSGEFAGANSYSERMLELGLRLQDMNAIGVGYNMVGEFGIILRGDYHKAERDYAESLRYAGLVKDQWQEYNLSARLMMLRVAEGKYAEAFQLGQTALAYARKFLGHHDTAWISGHLARCAWLMGDLTLARQLCHEQMALTRGTLSDPLFVVDPSYALGRIALVQKNYQAAARRLMEMMAKSGDLTPMAVDLFLDTAAVLLAQQGQAVKAAVLFGKAQIAYQKMRYYLAPFERDLHEQGLALARTGEESFDQAIQRGSQMALAEAVALARAALEKIAS